MLAIETRPLDRLIPYVRNARTHSPEQVAQIAGSIAEFGFVNPILIGSDDVIVAGHGRVLAAQRLGLTEVPVIVLAHLTEAQRRALVIADNRIAENAGWDEAMLRAELTALQEDAFDLDLLGFIVGAEIVHRHQGTPKFGRVRLQKVLYLAEAHAEIGELQGNYLREAAGPLDRALIAETERGMAAAGFCQASTSDGDTGNGITYAPLAKPGQHRSELTALLGPRAESLKRLVDVLRDLDTRAVEAIATLYAVWNDALADGESIDDAAVVRGVLTDWHSEKGEKFKEADLQTWLAWMRRHGLVPRGNGPRTSYQRPSGLTHKGPFAPSD